MERYIRNIVRQAVNEAMDDITFKPGSSLGFPNYEIGAAYIKSHYGNLDDFKYNGGGTFVYQPQKKKSSKISPRSKPKGRMEGETYEQYLERIKQVNQKFADAEAEIDGEIWKPIRNTGRYFGGMTDYTKSHEVSNMGRIRTIDFNDPMKSRISVGYDAPTRNAMQFHLDTKDENGQFLKTTPPIHTLVADAFLEPPEGNIEDYDVVHIDGDYHNNRADNLKYVLRKGRRRRKMNDDTALEDFVGECIRRTMARLLR